MPIYRIVKLLQRRGNWGTNLGGRGERPGTPEVEAETREREARGEKKDVSSQKKSAPPREGGVKRGSTLEEN